MQLARFSFVVTLVLGNGLGGALSAPAVIPAQNPGHRLSIHPGASLVPLRLMQAIEQTLGSDAEPRVAAFEQKQELTTNDAGPTDYFGVSVALSGDGHIALIGASNKNSFQGAAYVFTEHANTWIQQQQLTASDGAATDLFGYSVALSNDGHTALIGARQKNFFQGAAYVFTEHANTWTQQQELTASDATTGDLFGAQVALNSGGHIALIGALGKNSGQGAAYVFTEHANTWTQQQEVTATDGTPGDHFGTSVALSNDGHIAMIGAPNKNSEEGAAYVFTEHAKTWTQQQELTASDGAPGDLFGYSVALSGDGDIALIGAYGKNSDQGAAYVFTEHAKTWTQQQELTASDGGRDAFGLSVALSGNGHIALIGAEGKNSYEGAAYVFTEHANAWTQQQELTATDGALDFFGNSVALNNDGHIALIGAPNKNSLQGAAYVFTEHRCREDH